MLNLIVRNVGNEWSSCEVDSNVEVITEEPLKLVNIDGTTANATGLDNKNKKIVPKTHTCHFCNRNFPSSSLLATHVRVCQMNSLTIYIRLYLIELLFGEKFTQIHTGERPFECTMQNCSKSFKTQGNSLWIIKTNLFYQCNYVFVCSKGALDLHIRRHNGVKPYKCTVCDRAFVESSNLKVHMR